MDGVGHSRVFVIDVILYDSEVLLSLGLEAVTRVGIGEVQDPPVQAPVAISQCQYVVLRVYKSVGSNERGCEFNANVTDSSPQRIVGIMVHRVVSSLLSAAID